MVPALQGHDKMVGWGNRQRQAGPRADALGHLPGEWGSPGREGGTILGRGAQRPRTSPAQAVGLGKRFRQGGDGGLQGAWLESWEPPKGFIQRAPGRFRKVPHGGGLLRRASGPLSQGGLHPGTCGSVEESGCAAVLQKGLQGTERLRRCPIPASDPPPHPEFPPFATKKITCS